MIALVCWIVKVIIFYIVFTLVLKLFKLLFTIGSRKKNNPAKRFDTNNKDVSDADYKDIK